MGQLDKLGAKASQTVDVNIDERMMQLAAKFLSGKDPDEVKIKELVTGLKGIYVKVFEFEREGEYSQADIDSIRSQLTNPVWTRLLNVNSKKEGSIEVYLMTNASQIGGLVVLAMGSQGVSRCEYPRSSGSRKTQPARRTVWHSRSGN